MCQTLFIRTSKSLGPRRGPGTDAQVQHHLPPYPAGKWARHLRLSGARRTCPGILFRDTDERRSAGSLHVSVFFIRVRSMRQTHEGRSGRLTIFGLAKVAFAILAVAILFDPSLVSANSQPGVSSP